MTNLVTLIEETLHPLRGLRLSIARRAADMRGFHFGEIKPTPRGTSGVYVLHIQCAWRIDGSDGIVTGSSDLWRPAEKGPEFDWDTWHYEKSENLQDQKIGLLLQDYDATTRSYVNTTSLLVVEDIKADCCGDVTITLSGGYRLRLFPDCSVEENWRLFKADSSDPHFVIEGGNF